MESDGCNGSDAGEIVFEANHILKLMPIENRAAMHAGKRAHVLGARCYPSQMNSAVTLISSIHPSINEVLAPGLTERSNSAGVR